MTPDPERRAKLQSIGYPTGIALLAAGVLFLNLGSAALWDRDEPTNAGCALEMMVRGDWILPTFNGEIRTDKPPLLYWLMIVAFQWFGVTEFASRFWSAAAGVGSAVLTYVLGRQLFRPQVGLLAGLILSTSMMFVVVARAATHDSLLLLLSTAVLLVFARSKVFSNSGTRVDTATCLQIYLLLGLAVLAKGPAVAILPFTAILLFRMLRHQLRPSGASKASGVSDSNRLFGLRNWLQGPLRAFLQMRPMTGVALIFAVASPWYVWVGVRSGGTWVREFLLVHNIGRFAAPMQGHEGPIFYHLFALLVGFFPWSVFLIPAGVAWLQDKEGHKRDGRVIQYLTIWIGVQLLFYSLAATKLPHYPLPAYPALAVLTGHFLDRWRCGSTGTVRSWMRLAFGSLCLVGLAIILGFPALAKIYFPAEKWLGLAGVIPLLGGFICLMFQKVANPSRVLAAMATMGVLWVVVIFGFLPLRLDPYQNAKPLIAAVRATSGKNPEIASYRYLEPSLVFYARQRIPLLTDSKEVATFLAGDNAFLMTDEESWRQLKPVLDDDLVVFARHPRFLKSGSILVIGRGVANKDPQTR